MKRSPKHRERGREFLLPLLVLVALAYLIVVAP